MNTRHLHAQAVRAENLVRSSNTTAAVVQAEASTIAAVRA
jgi:hypothetical protein